MSINSIDTTLTNLGPHLNRNDSLDSIADKHGGTTIQRYNGHSSNHVGSPTIKGFVGVLSLFLTLLVAFCCFCSYQISTNTHHAELLKQTKYLVEEATNSVQFKTAKLESQYKKSTYETKIELEHLKTLINMQNTFFDKIKDDAANVKLQIAMTAQNLDHLEQNVEQTLLNKDHSWHYNASKEHKQWNKYLYPSTIAPIDYAAIGTKIMPMINVTFDRLNGLRQELEQVKSNVERVSRHITEGALDSIVKVSRIVSENDAGCMPLILDMKNSMDKLKFGRKGTF